VGSVQCGPAGLPFAHGVRAVGLGEAVDVDDRRAELLHGGDHGRAGRGAGRGDYQVTVQRVRFGGVGDGDQDGGGAVGVGDPLGVDGAPDLGGVDGAQADVGAADRGHAPGGAPAVAVEHRQGPQVDRVGTVPRVDDLGEGVEVGAAVVV